MNSKLCLRRKDITCLLAGSMMLSTGFCSAQEGVTRSSEQNGERVGDKWPVNPVYDPKDEFLIPPPILRPLEEDSFHMVEREKEFPGQVVYSSAQGNRALVFRSIGRSRQLGKVKSNIATYYASGRDIFSPHWYPHSEDIYFLFGDPFVPGNGALVYRWKVEEKKTVKTGFYRLQLRQIEWSPSGKLATFYSSRQIAPGTVFSTLTLLNLPLNRVSDIRPRVEETSVSWTPEDTLVFTALTGTPSVVPTQTKPAESPAVSKNRPAKTAPAKSSEKREVTSTSETASSTGRPNLYELTYPSTSGKAVQGANKAVQALNGKLLVKDALEPSVSPNGRWIAYTGWLTIGLDGKVVSSGTKGSKERYGLCLLERKTGKRHWLRPNEYDSVQWFPDSRDLLLIKRKRFYVMGLNQLLAEGRFPDMVPEEAKPFAEFTTSGPTNLEYKGFSNNEQYFFFKSSEIKNAQEQLFHRSLQALDLTNGQIKTVFEWTKDQGTLEDFDWLDESLPPVRSDKEKREEEEEEEKREEEENSR